jgi:hypothetical protein
MENAASVAALLADAQLGPPVLTSRKLFSATTIHVPQPTEVSPVAAVQSSSSAVKLAAAAADRPSAVDLLYRCAPVHRGRASGLAWSARWAQGLKGRAQRAPTVPSAAPGR